MLVCTHTHRCIVHIARTVPIADKKCDINNPSQNIPLSPPFARFKWFYTCFFTKINKINTHLCMHSLRIYAFVVLQLSKRQQRWMRMSKRLNKNFMCTNKRFRFSFCKRSYQRSMVAAQPSKQKKKLYYNPKQIVCICKRKAIYTFTTFSGV